MQWSEFLAPKGAGILAKAKGKFAAKKLGIEGLRCGSCGYLELYAGATRAGEAQLWCAHLAAPAHGRKWH